MILSIMKTFMSCNTMSPVFAVIVMPVMVAVSSISNERDRGRNQCIYASCLFQ